MDERARRLWAGTEAGAIGWGGVAAVARATGMAISTVRKGRDEARRGATPEDVVKVRRSAGKRPYEVAHPEVWPALDVQEHARVVRRAVRAARHPDQPQDGGQAAARPRLQLAGAKQVRRRCPASRPQRAVRAHQREDVHDFPSDAVGKAIPYGVYDLAANEGFVSVGVDHDTPVFAVTSIEAWWSRVGAKRYPEAREIFITADAGGSNSYRSHVWKHQLQRVADKLDMSIHVSHFPPGTSRWNKVEHRLFSFISINWRGRPLRTYETVINLIGNTTNRGALVVRVRLDRRRYPTGKKISKKELRELKVEREEFHGEWNYVIRSRMEQR